HAVSKDLVNWNYMGTCFTPSLGPTFDDWTTWTGSVLQGPDGTWHLFYTGTPHAEGGLKQRIGHATSRDMHSWMRVDDGLCLDLTGPNAKFYEEYTPGHWPDRAMRDPWVIKNPDGDGWLMYFTARVPGRTEPNAGGAIGFATSPDLVAWTLQKPIYDAGEFGQLEVPQVFKFGRKWYMTFCTAAEHWSVAYRRRNPQKPVTGSHYMIADSHLGPWSVPVPFLDGGTPCERYAGKIIERDGKLFLMGFLYYDAQGKFVGQVSDPVPLAVDESGLLSVVLA
ncbi:MAG: glycoside hydrolase family 68 protein, partial [Alphaproteobacteria bacterium]|nr:glycoside hydrolase family 68 protein [Alphaproteobacteria bacterium]